MHIQSKNLSNDIHLHLEYKWKIVRQPVIKAFSCSSPYCLAAGQPREPTEENGSGGRNAHVEQRTAFLKGEKNEANTPSCQSLLRYMEEWSKIEGEAETAAGSSLLLSSKPVCPKSWNRKHFCVRIGSALHWGRLCGEAGRNQAGISWELQHLSQPGRHTSLRCQCCHDWTNNLKMAIIYLDNSI